MDEQKRTWLQPFSIRDIGLSALFNSGLVVIWNFGDFHSFHYGDTVVFSLISIYRWTVFAWEYDHVGSLLLLAVSFIKRPYWNLLALDGLTAFLFLAGFALWSSLLSFRKSTLTENSVWVALLLPVIMAKTRIFANAAHGITSGAAFFFAGLFTACLLRYLKPEQRVLRPVLAAALLLFGFLATYLAKTMLIPLGIVTLGLIWPYLKQIVLAGKNGQYHLITTGTSLAVLVPPLSLVVALLIYQYLERQVPTRIDMALDISNIPTALPRLLVNWSKQELSTSLVVLLPLPLLFHKQVWKALRFGNPLLAYLTAGVALEAIIVSSSKWVVFNVYHGYYLTNLEFLLLLATIAFGAYFVFSLVPYRLRTFILLAVVAILVNVYEWNTLTPAYPLATLERTIGATTSTIIEAQCDILIGHYHRVWPAMMAVNDYYYRHNTLDSRTGTTRWVAAIAARAWPTEDRWRPMLDWPDAKICSFADDDGIQWAMNAYVPDIILLMPHETSVGPLVVSQLENRRLPSLGFEFDNVAPGSGWHGQESTPDGQTFQWMKEAATLTLPLAANHDLLLRFRVRPALEPGILPSLTLAVNGRPVVLTSRPHANGDTAFEAVIPKTLLDNPRYTQLVFRVSHTVIPNDLYGNGDTRALGLAFDWLRLDPTGK